MIENILCDIGSVLVVGDQEATVREFSFYSRMPAEQFGREHVFLPHLQPTFERGKVSAEQYYREFLDISGCRLSFRHFAIIWAKHFVEVQPMIRLGHRLARNYNPANICDLNVNLASDSVTEVDLGDIIMRKTEWDDCTLTGLVYDETTKALLSDVRVAIKVIGANETDASVDIHYVTTTDSDGQFKIYNFPAKDYTSGWTATVVKMSKTNYVTETNTDISTLIGDISEKYCSTAGFVKLYVYTIAFSIASLFPSSLKETFKFTLDSSLIS